MSRSASLARLGDGFGNRSQGFCESGVEIDTGPGEVRHVENGRASAGLGLCSASTHFSKGAVSAKDEASFIA
jgi:hypothetical protein